MKSRLIVCVLIAGLILRLFLSIQIYSGDVNNHISWGKDVLVNGFQGIYQRDFFPEYGTLTPTYPPIPIFLFTFFYWLYSVSYKLAWIFNLNFSFFPSNIIFFLEDQDVLPAFLKIPAIIADIGLGLVVYAFSKRLIKEKKVSKQTWPLFLVIFNPVFIYNSAYWGQIESIPLLFLLSSFFTLFYSKKYYLSPILFTLAILTKQTTIIFIPIYAIAYLAEFGLRNSIKGTLISLILFFTAFLPFYKSGNVLTYPVITYWQKIQTGSGSDYVTDHAFNFWALITGLGKISDSNYLGIFSYKIWGYLIFGISTVLTLLGLRNGKKSVYKFIFASFLISLSAFLFLTRMHERYLIQTLPFALLLFIKNRKYLLVYVFLSFVALVNLYHNWWAPRIDVLVNVLSNIYVINTLIVCLIVLYFLFFLQYTKVNKSSVRSL